MIPVILSLILAPALAQWYAPIVPVADLRARPEEASLNYGCCDPLQLTQVLFGECLSFVNESDGWMAVRVPSQYTGRQEEHALVPSIGFIRSNQTVLIADSYKCDAFEYMTLAANKLQIPIYQRACVPGCLGTDILLYASLGNRFQPAHIRGPSPDWISIALPSGLVGWVLASDVNSVSISWQVDKNQVKDIINTANELMGMVYFKGGRSAYDPRSSNQLTGISDAGLVNLAHQTYGIVLPIDAGGMFMLSYYGPHIPLVEGTLFFLNNSVGYIDYVSLYVGEGFLIESSRESNVNSSRLISVEERFGVSVMDLKYGMPIGNNTLLWGDYFGQPRVFKEEKY